MISQRWGFLWNRRHVSVRHVDDLVHPGTALATEDGEISMSAYGIIILLPILESRTAGETGHRICAFIAVVEAGGSHGYWEWFDVHWPFVK